MNQPEQELARNIVRHLDYGLQEMPSETRERLLAARRAALARYRERPAAVSVLAWAGQAVGHLTREHRFSGARHLAAILLLVLALVGMAYWQSMGPVRELADLDSSLLADELPINAYLDKGFDSWLKRSSR